MGACPLKLSLCLSDQQHLKGHHHQRIGQLQLRVWLWVHRECQLHSLLCNHLTSIQAFKATASKSLAEAAVAWLPLVDILHISPLSALRYDLSPYPLTSRHALALVFFCEFTEYLCLALVPLCAACPQRLHAFLHSNLRHASSPGITKHQ